MTNSQSRLSYLGQAALSAQLEVISGLHIGAGKDAIEIGGIDNPVVKTPDGKPYVPGSSLKGKLRFLLEWAFGTVRNDGKPWGSEDEDFDPDDPVLRIFGTPAKKESWNSGPTRLLMRDAIPHEDWTSTKVDLTEEKTEISMDRIAGKARDGGLRRTERVPPGATFKFEAAFRLYDVNGDHGARDLECLGWLVQGLSLLEQDALGGSGSRGYGHVRFGDLRLTFPGGGEISLDNSFRGHVFSRESPPGDIMDILKEPSSILIQAQE
ncbi:MAG: type III-A CRISPR-associated RAMP protein Csm3 [Gammaproteobacteria bacterium]|nr:type III-A CRISPR-associated RAMP protein Csm3 [Gammaproteobacteria bacterium]